MKHILTFDIEEYFQVSGFARHVPIDTWDTFTSRVERPTARILELLAEHGVQATFFILGWIARRHADLVRQIAAAGHEIGSHSDLHRLIYDLSPEEFRDDLLRSKHILEDITGTPVHSFRAPSFSITRRSLWALDVLAECGFRYDASIFPIVHDRYGIPDAPRGIHRIERAAGTLIEVPGTVAGVFGMRLPVGGGGYLRLYPWCVTRRLLHRIERRDRRPVVVYVHPWELDPDQPRLAGPSRVSRFRHYVNLHTTETKLKNLLASFSWDRLDRCAEAWSAAHPPEDVPSAEYLPA